MRIEVKSASELSTFEKARQDCVVTSSLYAFLTGTKWANCGLDGNGLGGRRPGYQRPHRRAHSQGG